MTPEGREASQPDGTVQRGDPGAFDTQAKPHIVAVALDANYAPKHRLARDDTIGLQAVVPTQHPPGR